MIPAFLSAMAKDLLLPVEELVRLAWTAPHRYKVYEVKKMRGGKRVIAQPARVIKTMQRWVMEKMLDALPVHENALGYRRGKNIADNAAVHAPNNLLLKLDFANFFPSIVHADILNFVAANPPLTTALPDENARDLFSRILLWAPKRDRIKRLSIGAPSSPLVSNLLMYQFDQAVAELCSGRRVAYSRYADDLTFSGNDLPNLQAVYGGVERIVLEQQSPKLALNPSKVFYGTKAGRRTVTGLVLTNDGKVSLGRDKKRLLRAMVHHALNDSLSEEVRMTLLGWIAFANAVEPSFAGRLKETFGADLVDRIRNGNGKP